MNLQTMKRAIILIAMLFTWVNANDNILVYKIQNQNHKISAQTVADGLKNSGYTVAKNQDMNGPYKKQFGNTVFESYNLMSVYHPDFAKKLVVKYDKAGIFVPFSIAVYQRQNDDNLYVALLSASAQEKILDIKDVLFNELEALNKKTMKKIFPTAQESFLNYEATNTKSELYTKYSFDVDDEDANSGYDDMMMMMEGNMKTNGFVVANYLDFNAELKNNGMNDYMFYHSYSLCKLKIIYELSKATPEAGAFAPCTMVIYHKKGSNKTEIVSLNINSLISMLSLKDKELLKMLDDTQADMTTIIQDSTE